MTRARVLVLGGNFAGLTAALAVQHELDGDVDVHVVSASDHFLFTPSLIWLPFGKRRAEDITFPLAPTFAAHDIEFTHAAATRIDLDGRKVETTAGVVDYDYLVIATGSRPDLTTVAGIGEDGPAHHISTLDAATRAGVGWRALVKNPGPVVIGAAQGASCFGASYEYLFNVAHQLKRAGLDDRVTLTYVSPEPFLGHFGIGGLPHGETLLRTFMKRAHIEHVVDTGISEIGDSRISLTNGRRLEYRYAMVMPPFLGQQVIADVPEIADDTGCVRVRETYQTKTRDEVYAVGVAAAVDVPWTSAVPVGIPKTGFPSEQQARAAARNIAAQVRGDAPEAHTAFGEMPAVCIMDAGNNGVLILADRMLPPRKHGVMVPGPQSHGLRVAFEKYSLWKAQHGYVNLP